MSKQRIKAGGADFELGVKSKLKAGLDQATRRLRAFASTTRQIGSTMAQAFAPLGLALGTATKIFSDFDDNIRLVAAVTGATGDAFDSLTEKAKELGRTTSFTASQVASAMVELGRAGLTAGEIEAAIPGILDLSRATGTELAESAQIAADTLRGFRLDVSEMPRVVDTLTAAANGSSQTLTDLFEAMKLAGPIAAATGEAIEDTATQVGLLANAGIKGSLAGTALRSAYLNLADPKIQEALKELTGVNATDGAGNLRKLQEILEDVGNATNNFGTAEGLAAFNQIFGTRGLVAASNLAKAGAEFDKLNEKIRASGGIAAETAKKMDAGVGGFIRLTLSALEGVAIAIGEAIAPALNALRGPLGGILGAMSKWVEQNKGIVTAVLAVTGAGLGLAGVLLGVAGAATILSGITFGLSAAISGAAAVGSGLMAIFGAILSPIGLVTAAIAGAAAYFLFFTETGKTVIDWFGTNFAKLQAIVGDTFKGIFDAIAGGDLALAGKIAFTGLKLAAATILESLTSLFGSSIQAMSKMIAELYKNVATLAARVNEARVSAVNWLSGKIGGLIGVDTSLEQDAATAQAQAWSGAINDIDTSKLGDSIAAALDPSTLQEELDGLVATAKSVREASEARRDEIKSAEAPKLPGAPNLPKLAEKAFGSIGGFSVASINRNIPGKRNEEKIVKATEQTAVNTKEILAVARASRLTFG